MKRKKPSERMEEELKDDIPFDHYRVDDYYMKLMTDECLTPQFFVADNRTIPIFDGNEEHKYSWLSLLSRSH